jgi:DNA-binding NarL/FixJ family response regulator
MENIYIAIADDHPMVISGLTTLLHPYRHIVVQNAYNTAAQLLEGFQFYQPDVLLLDILLPDRSGKDLVPIIRKTYPQVRILALTSLDAPAMVTSMLRRGCTGYLLKGAGPATLANAIETVYKGENYIETGLKEQLLQNVIGFKQQTSDQAVLPGLTQREKEVLELIAAEYTTKEIAEKLFISYRTAENHRCSLIQKLDVKNTVGLIKVAIQLGLVK